MSKEVPNKRYTAEFKQHVIDTVLLHTLGDPLVA